MPPKSKKALLKPPPLLPGDKIGIIAPASNVDRQAFKVGCDSLRRMGYTPVFQDNIFDRDLYFAGTAARRARELEEMFERDDIRAILCARGGYGCNYLLPQIDLDKVWRHPKIFAGYSDITSLHTVFCDVVGLVTFHAPMLAKDFAVEGGVDLASWNAATGGQPRWELASHMQHGLSPMVEGQADGVLYGGCLSIVVASLGTPYEIRTDGKVLFLEDANERPYKVDRLLMQLKLAGKFRKIKGIVFGEMLDCGAPEASYTLQEVVKRIVGDLGVPVAYGLRSGHVERANITLPLGVAVTLTVSQEAVRLEFLEAATKPVGVSGRSARS